jgi:hypothetical protein
MQPHFHAVVWIDHHQAKVFRFNAEDVQRAVVHPHDPTVHLHHGHAPVDKVFLEGVATAMTGAGTILIVGPAGAKTELATHLAAHAPEVSARVTSVEALDHPTGGELVALARGFFHASDRMHPPA